MRTGSVEANGLRFAYLEDGPDDGPLVLCLHGFPDHAPTFEPLLADLAAAGFRGVAPWMRGYDPTAVPQDGRYHGTTLALDAVALADALAAGGDSYLVGHDWGAVCAYPAVAYRPDRFRRLVTLAVPPPGAIGRMFTSPRQLKRSWYMFFFQSAFAEPAVRANDFAFIDMLWSDWSPGYNVPPAFMRSLKDTLAAPGSLEAALGYYRAALGGSGPPDDAPAELRSAGGRPITVPTLYLHGAADGCMGAELLDGVDFAPGFPSGIEVQVVDGAGHFLHLERPAEVNARIVGFLRQA